MTNQEILIKAITKAVKNGWTGEDSWCQECGIDWFYVIFSHDFAQHLWGDGKLSGSSVVDGQEWEITLGDGSHKYLPRKNWQYHLQQMVIAPDPIAYLGEHV